MRLRILDYVSILFTIAVIAVISVSVYGGNSKAEYVSVKASEKEYLYPLDTDRTVKVDGPIGTTTIEIENGMVQVVDSPCRDKLCMKAAPLKKGGDWNACMPNKVFIRITGGGKNKLDSLSY